MCVEHDRCIHDRPGNSIRAGHTWVSEQVWRQGRWQANSSRILMSWSASMIRRIRKEVSIFLDNRKWCGTLLFVAAETNVPGSHGRRLVTTKDETRHVSLILFKAYGTIRFVVDSLACERRLNKGIKNSPGLLDMRKYAWYTSPCRQRPVLRSGADHSQGDISLSSAAVLDRPLAFVSPAPYQLTCVPCVVRAHHTTYRRSGEREMPARFTIF